MTWLLHTELRHDAFCFLMSFSTIITMSTSVSNSNSTFAFLRHVCNVNPGAEKMYAGSCSCISMHYVFHFSETGNMKNNFLFIAIVNVMLLVSICFMFKASLTKKIGNIDLY